MIVVAADNFIDRNIISFDANLVMYMNRTSIPPRNTRNKMYGNQNFWFIIPLIVHVNIVCIIVIIPMAIGCFICVNSILIDVLEITIVFMISECSLIKMLVLGINDRVFFSLKS